MPEMKQWRENPEEELARLIPTNEMTNFWSPNVDIMVNPGETAVIIREGAIVELLCPKLTDLTWLEADVLFYPTLDNSVDSIGTSDIWNNFGLKGEGTTTRL